MHFFVFIFLLLCFPAQAGFERNIGGTGFSNPWETHDYALSFDGVDDEASVNTAVVSDFPCSFVIETRTSEIANNNPFSIVDTSESDQQILGGFVNSGGNLKIRISQFNGSFISSNSSSVFNINTWYHVVFVYRSATDRELYVDSVSEATLTTNQSFPTGLDNTAIAAQNDTSPANSKNDVRDFKIYNKSLSTDEISDLYNGRSVTNGLVSHWDFSDGRGSTLNDIFGSNDMTITGATWVEL